MVRGPSAVLAACALALAYALCAGLLPDLGDGDGAVIAAAGVGLLLVTAIAIAIVSCDGAPAPAALIAAGGGLLMGALDVAGENTAAIVPEAVFAAAIGILLARRLLAFAGPLVAVAIPVFVALVDTWSVASGPSSRLVHGDPRGVTGLTFDLPGWGDAFDGSVARLGLVDVVFLAAFATWTVRLGLRVRTTAGAMACSLLATLALSVAADRTIPALPLLAVAFVLPNIDRLVRLVREAVGSRPANSAR